MKLKIMEHKIENYFKLKNKCFCTLKIMLNERRIGRNFVYIRALYQIRELEMGVFC